MPLVINVSVIPSSGQYRWKLDKSDRLVCYLKSVPENNKANIELCRGIAKAVSCAYEDVCIITGMTQRKKTIRIKADLTLEQFLDKVGIDRQTSLIR